MNPPLVAAGLEDVRAWAAGHAHVEAAIPYGSVAPGTAGGGRDAGGGRAQGAPPGPDRPDALTATVHSRDSIPRPPPAEGEGGALQGDVRVPVGPPVQAGEVREPPRRPLGPRP